MRAGCVIVKVRCEHCMKRIATDRGTETCQCLIPSPKKFEMHVMSPAKKLPPPVVEVAACAS